MRSNEQILPEFRTDGDFPQSQFQRQKTPEIKRNLILPSSQCVCSLPKL